MVKEELRTRTEVVGTTVGLIVFFAGVVLLVFVFILALGLFRDPGMLTAAVTPVPGKPAASPDLVGTLATLGIRIAALFVMAIAASVVASKGIHLYLAGR